MGNAPRSLVTYDCRGRVEESLVHSEEIAVLLPVLKRLSQRLAHVSDSLAELTDVVADPARLYNPYAWLALQQKIRSKYTMEDEKLMFDTLLQTGDVRQALEQFVAKKQAAAGGSSDIELF